MTYPIPCAIMNLGPETGYYYKKLYGRTPLPMSAREGCFSIEKRLNFVNFHYFDLHFYVCCAIIKQRGSDEYAVFAPYICCETAPFCENLPIIMRKYGNHSKNLYSFKFILSEHPYNEDTETEQKGVKTYGVRLRMS